MRRYRNKKSGAVIEVYGVVNGKNWEPLDEAPVSVPEELQDPYAEIFGKDAAEIPVEDPTPAKPRASRKGRK